eukprot:jgi/Psemu1/65877/estExt_Genemark1.C_1600052
MAERPVMYLEQEDWSPRYQDTFYTVRMDHFDRFTSPPDNDHHGSLPPNDFGAKKTFPAYYYKIEVLCGRHDPKVVYRRYSQVGNSNSGEQQQAIQLPPGSGCLCSQNDDFAKNRLEQLREFLNEVLVRREVACSDVVAQFLQLDSFIETAPTS